MGITVLTLANLSLDESRSFPDHKSGDYAHVIVDGMTDSTKRYPQGHPIYILKYDSGFRCGVKWKDGQAIPAYGLGVIPFLKGGRHAWFEQAFKNPSSCSFVDESKM